MFSIIFDVNNLNLMDNINKLRMSTIQNILGLKLFLNKLL